MNPLVILACIVQTAEVGPQTDARCQRPYVVEVQKVIERWAERYHVPVVYEAAKIYHESRFDKHAHGSHGEVGLTQIKRHGAIQGRDLRLTRRQLEDVDKNVEIGTRYLAQFVPQCAHPSGWLTKYNRPARGCRPSRYSLGVLADLRAARRVRLSGSAARSSYDTEASGWTPRTDESQTWERTSTARTSCMLELPHTCPGTGEHPRADTDPEPGTKKRTPEELAAPFREP